KVESDERDVLQSIEVTLPSRDDGLRALADQVIHNRKIMRSKIPDHVDVVLEKAKIHAHGVVVIESPKCVLAQKFMNFAYGWREQEGVVHHDLQVLFFRQFD